MGTLVPLSQNKPQNLQFPPGLQVNSDLQQQYYWYKSELIHISESGLEWTIWYDTASAADPLPSKAHSVHSTPVADFSCSIITPPSPRHQSYLFWWASLCTQVPMGRVWPSCRCCQQTCCHKALFGTFHGTSGTSLSCNWAELYVCTYISI